MLPDKANVVTSDYETVGFTVQPRGTKKINFIGVYRIPDGKIDKLKEHILEISGMVNTDMTETIIIGDFNMNYMDEKHMRQCKFKNFLLELSMRQMINEGTRITKKSRTTIDLIITDCPYVNCVGTLNVNMSDHLPIYLIRKKVREKVLKLVLKLWGRSYRRYESNRFKRSIIEADWSEFDDTGDPEKLREIMREISEKPLDKFCPITKLMIPEKKPKWINADILKLMRQRYIIP